MANRSKAKGYRFEKSIVDTLVSQGIEATRAWGSNGRAIGESEEVDILIPTRSERFGTLKVQAKCRAKLGQIVKPGEAVDLQLIKEDRGETYVVLPLPLFIKLIKGVKDGENKTAVKDDSMLA